jgi:hypothetical protein
MVPVGKLSLGRILNVVGSSIDPFIEIYLSSMFCGSNPLQVYHSFKSNSSHRNSNNPHSILLYPTQSSNSTAHTLGHYINVNLAMVHYKRSITKLLSFGLVLHESYLAHFIKSLLLHHNLPFNSGSLLYYFISICLENIILLLKQHRGELVVSSSSNSHSVIKDCFMAYLEYVNQITPSLVATQRTYSTSHIVSLLCC